MGRNKTVGVAMIVKNEEAMLERCLKSVAGADEIVICDTGSADRTVQIAKRFSDRVYEDFKWCDDFAAARNHVREKMTTDWILSIDADEILRCHFGMVRNAVDRGRDAINVTLVGASDGQRNLFTRLFRNTPHVYWVGAVHNHLSVTGENVGNSIEIEYGYSPAHLLDPDRELRILEREVAKGPHMVREAFYLGRKYFYLDRMKECVETMHRYVQYSRFPAERAEAFYIMARALWNLRQGDAAREACAQAILINANFKEAIEFMAILAGEGTGDHRWEQNAAQWRRMSFTANNDDVLFVRSHADPNKASNPAVGARA